MIAALFLTGATDPAAIAALVTAILGAGGLGAILALKKTGAEAEAIAAQTLIAVNKELREELARRDGEIAALRERVAVLEDHRRVSD